MNFEDFKFIDPSSLSCTNVLWCNGRSIRWLWLPHNGSYEYEKYTWVALEDITKAFGLVLKPDMYQPYHYDVYLEKTQHLKFFGEETSNGYYSRSIKGAPIETWDITQAWDLGRCESQALQYILRAKYKGQEKEDLEKAIKFLQRALEEMEED